MRRYIVLSILIFCGLSAGAQKGFYTNPIIHADYSDPDVCAVGGDYYMTASSFNCAPGLPILHSTDLVHWKTIGYALENGSPDAPCGVPMHGCGVWAPCIRHHDGEFYIYWGDPDEGIYMVKSSTPDRNWSKPVRVKAGRGMIDPSPLWDEDGRVYLVHGWAASRCGFNSVLTMMELNSEGTAPISEPVLVYDGNPDGNFTVEGPKLYKRDGYYYIMAPAGGVKTGWQIALRSSEIYGPYEVRTVMAQGKSKVNGPHQGAWVHTVMDEDWFIHFQDKEAYGRIVHLQPMCWKDSWPVIGSDRDADGCGEPVERFQAPKISPDTTSYAACANPMGEEMEWHAVPQNWFGFPTQMGYSRVYAYQLSQNFVNFWEVPNLLLRKFPREEFTATASLKVSATREGQASGLVVMGRDYCRLSVRRVDKGFVLEQIVCRDAENGGREEAVELAQLPASQEFGEGSYHTAERNVFLRCTVAKGAVCSFSYSLDGDKFIPVGVEFNARAGRWIGAKVGIFSVAPYSLPRGWVDIYGFELGESATKIP